MKVRADDSVCAYNEGLVRSGEEDLVGQFLTLRLFGIFFTHSNCNGREYVLHTLPEFRQTLMLEAFSIAGLAFKISAIGFVCDGVWAGFLVLSLEKW